MSCFPFPNATGAPSRALVLIAVWICEQPFQEVLHICLRYVAEHEDEVTDAAGHYKKMEHFVGTKIREAATENF